MDALLGVNIESGSVTNSTLTGRTTSTNEADTPWAIFNKGTPGDVGFGNNYIVGLINSATPMQPNVCIPACP